MITKITPEEIEIIKKAQTGNEHAFTQLFNRYKVFVDKLLTSYIGDKDEAKDITNIVFLKVHAKLSKFKDYSSFGGWLRILTKNVAIDYLRTVKDSASITEETFVGSSDDYVDPEDDLVNSDYHQRLLDMIEEVAPLYRDTAFMFYRDGMTVAEISKALRVSKGTIKSRLHRVRNKIKSILNLEHVDDSSTTNGCRDDNLCNRSLQQKQ